MNERRPRTCYYCGEPYRRRDLVEAWVDPGKPADKGGKKIIRAGVGCGCAGVSKLLRRLSLRPVRRKRKVTAA